MKKSQLSILNGAAFLMATSAIGPGFLTQTTVFTSKLTASFGFVILLSIVLDVVVQLNIWRVLCTQGKYAQLVANQTLKNSGTLLSVLILIGGFAFNIGNIGGAGLGLNATFGWPVEIGAMLSAIVAVGIFLMKDFGQAVDLFSKVLGVLIFLLILSLCFQSKPPVGTALTEVFWPKQFDALATVTLVGGTVGGYITFAGAHRLIDAGVVGETNLPLINLGASRGIVLTGIIRFLLFLGVLGVVMAGAQIDASNPPASVFQFAFGNIGLKLFGLLMWMASITSIVGSAYTSVSFIKTMNKNFEKNHKLLIIIFITLSTIIFCLVGKPAQLLVYVGFLNGLILPISMSILLISAKKIMPKHLHNPVLWWLGWGVVALMLGFSVYSGMGIMKV